MTLAEFLTARFDEIEADARAAADAFGDAVWKPLRRESWSDAIVASSTGVAVLTGAASVLPHALRHDPAYVLADVAAKRRIVEHCSDWRANEYEVGPVLEFLALPFAGHPDYREEWRP